MKIKDKRIIKEHEYSDKDFEEIILPNGLEKIGAFAFSNCKELKKIIIPKSCVDIEMAAFRNCFNLEEVYFEGNTRIDYSTFENCISLRKINLPYQKRIPSSAFKNTPSLQSIDLGNDVTEIGVSAFESSGLKKIVIPDKIYGIARKAFYECIWLETVIIGKNIRNVEEFAFANCTSLKEINFNKESEANLVNLNIFQNCKNLEYIYLGNTKMIQENIFKDATNIKHIFVDKEKIDKKFLEKYKDKILFNDLELDDLIALGKSFKEANKIYTGLGRER